MSLVHNQFNSPWSEDRIGTLKTMFFSGETYAKIAIVIGINRGAVAGKVNRLGIERPPRPKLSPEEKRAKRTAYAREYRKRNPDIIKAIERRARLKRLGEDAERNRRRKIDSATPLTDLRLLPGDTPAHERVHIVDLNDNHCRWPYEGLTFCGRKKARGSYCEHHAGRAYF